MKCSICDNDIPTKKKGYRSDLCDRCDDSIDDALSIFKEESAEDTDGNPLYEDTKELERSGILEREDVGEFEEES